MTIHAHALLSGNDGTLVSSCDSVVRCRTLPRELRQAPSPGTPVAHRYGVTAERFGQVEPHGRTAAEVIADLLPAGLVPEAAARVEQLEAEDVPNGGVRTVALATTHRAGELDADLAVDDLAALRALATGGGVGVSVRD
ncbi:hypothetical protein Shyhy01_51120 [Streptomyces hygroscopicus subsp. hygroscopicus]|nr:hypothetical protein [Streptomyces hygroscopicus]GLX52162.1 hypothetical protein Shyhy01_51120 [Streptomyces hygroscopicus subsp. hygroscopicus]